MVFHSSLVGFMFVTEGWKQLVGGVSFMTSFDNFLLELLFDNKFFNETLSIGNVYLPEAATSMEMLFMGTEYALENVLLGIAPGIVASGLVIILMAIFLIAKKAINPTVPMIILGSFLVTSYIITMATGEDALFPIYHVFSSGFLFVVIFIASDPITTPIPLKGKIVFGVLVGVITMFIYNGINYKDGKLSEPIIYGTLFMMMLTPMLNEVFKVKKKIVKKPPVNKIAKEGV